MVNEAQLDFAKKLTYQGRALAFYEDGRDYGLVTVMSVKNSAHIVSSHTCFIYSEVDHRLIGMCSTGGHTNKKTFEENTADCGRKYVLECNTQNGNNIYIGVFF